MDNRQAAYSGTIAQLADLLDETTLLITPNQRLSRALATALADFYSQQHTAWPTPNILSLNHCLQQWLGEYQFKGMVNSKPLAQLSEELDLWQTIIAAADQTLLRPKSTAKTARNAYTALQEWCLDPELESFSFNSNDDSTAFLGWYRTYLKEKDGRPWLAAVDAYQQLAACMQTLPYRVVMVGFNDLAPLYQKIINHAEAHIDFDWQVTPQQISIYAAPKPQDELLQMVRWAYDLRQTQPKANIAICIPDLAQRRDEVVHCFDRQFQAQAIRPDQQRSEAYYDISTGINLAEAPLVKTWLTLLSGARQTLDLPEWQALSQSPFITLLNNASQHRLLQQYPLPQASLGELVAWLPHDDSTVVNHVWQWVKQLPKRASLSEWLAHFKAVAELCQWLEQRSLSSTEYQQRQVLEKHLQTYKHLQLKQAKLSYNEALALLKDFLAQQVYHSQAPATGLSILGSLEASGQVFDYLWLSGLADVTWPAAISPNPFIPSVLQQEHELPRGSVNRELRYATKMLNDFSHAASTIVFSYSAYLDDVETTITSLIDLQTHQPYIPNILPVVSFDAQYEWYDEPVIPVATDKNTISATGLASQSQCPFKSFARNRLNLQSPITRSEGLTAADRGSLLHRAFEAFFTQGIPSVELDHSEAVEAAVNIAINRMPAIKKRLYGEVLLSVEKMRLNLLLQEWLATIEAERNDVSIHALEFEHTVTIAGLEIHMRLDRIDQRADGRWLVIDYKSSAYSSPKWFGERLGEAQVPLYAVALNKQHAISGIAIGHVRPDQIKLGEVGCNTVSAKAVDESAWQALLQDWTLQITALAHEYKIGVATVTPIDKNICNYCEYNGLCRVYEVKEEVFSE